MLVNKPIREVLRNWSSKRFGGNASICLVLITDLIVFVVNKHTFDVVDQRQTADWMGLIIV